jgi:hypothetical protein
MGTPHEKPGDVVLVQQMAADLQPETRRVADGNAGESPLPREMHYNEYSGEQYLLDLAPLPLDAKLNEFCQRFIESGPFERSLIRSSLNQNDFYTLMTFTGRSAALALRQHAAQRVANGLVAMAAMKLDCVDPRDVSSALGLLYFVANGIGEDAEKHFRAAAMLAEPRSSERILSFIESPARAKGINSMCLAIVQTKEGPSVIRREIKPYTPTVPMDSVAVEIAELIHLDKYLPQISLASGLPPIWLRCIDDRALFDVLQAVRAGATIQGTLRPNESPDPRDQLFVIFLVEAASPSDAKTLLKLVEAKIASPSDIAILGIGAGSLFCLVVARSVVKGKESYETCGSLTRFANGLQAILSNYQ